MKRVRSAALPITLPILAPLLMGASPHRGLDLQAAPASPPPLLGPLTPGRVMPQVGGDYVPAPTPNRDVDAPAGPRASNDPRLSPMLFNRRDQYRGEALDPKSSSQIEQERRVIPGAGFNLRMPLAPQTPN